MATYLSSQWRIQVAVQGVKLDTAPWSKATGGDRAGAGTTFAAGNMGDAFAVPGGVRTRNPLVVSREWSDEMIGAYIALDDASDRATMTVTLTPVRTPKVTAGKPIVYTGVVAGVKRPDIDSNSSTVEMLELTMTSNSSISGGGL